MIRFACPNCETNLKTGDEKAGTKILCPECKDRVTVPSASGDKKAGGKAAAGKRPNAPKSNKGLIIGVAAAACVVVAGGGILVAMQFMNNDKPKDTKSDNTTSVANNTTTDTTPPSVTATTTSGPGAASSGTRAETQTPPTTAKTPPTTGNAPDNKVPQAGPPSTSTETVEAASLSAEKVCKRLLRSTAWIVTELSDGRVGSGSGGLIDKKNRLVLTNEHVISEAEKTSGKSTLSLLFPEYDSSGQLITEQKPYLDKLLRHEGIACYVVAKDQKRDVALVQLTALPPNVQELRLARQSVVQNQRVYSLGCPSPRTVGALWIPTQGNVRTVINHDWYSVGDPREAPTHHHAKVVITDSPTNPGDSGGPLVNDRQELVAIVHGANVSLRGFSTFIDVSEIRAFINSYYKKEKLPLLPEGAANEERNEDVPTLAQKLKDPDTNRRVRAATLLAKIGVDAKAAVPALIETLKDPNDEVRTAVADALSAIGGITQAQLPALTEALKDKVPVVRKSVLEILKGMGAEADTVIPAIVAALKDTDKGVRLAAVQALGQMGAVARAALPALIATMKEDTSPEVKAEAATALSRMGRAAVPALEALGEAVKDNYQDLRVNALRAIQAIGPEAKSLVPALEKALAERDENTRLEALRALGEIGTDAKAAVPSMIKLLTNKTYHTPVAEALAKIGQPAVGPLQGTLGLGNPKWEARLGAVLCLKQLGSDAKPALRVLNAHVTLDTNAEVRKAALEAVKKIQAS